jgi:hypothetical protein
MLKRAYFTRGEKVGGFFACLKIVESPLFKQALVVCELERLKFPF